MTHHIKTLNIQRERGIALASCQEVPSVMVIAGPNGAGKSTLLEAIWRHSGRNDVLYVGPHRSIVPQQVQWRTLLTRQLLYSQTLASQEINGVEGIRIFGNDRGARGLDNAAQFLKHSLCQLDIARQTALTTLYDRNQEIPKDAFPDIWAPLKEATSNLLPHLSFARVDKSAPDYVRVLWRLSDSPAMEVDLDDLSSGEKAVIQIFYPLIEHKMHALLKRVAPEASGQVVRPRCLLIDEPELHLHPSLQMKVMDYVRQLAVTDDIQTIVASHSPTIVDTALAEELYLLRPKHSVRPGENQLLRAADNDDRLAELRSIFGTTSTLTSLQPIVVVEGVSENADSRVCSDRKLYRALHPGFDRVNMIAAGGKAEALRLRSVLEQTMRDYAPSFAAVALLDRDLSDASAPSGVAYLNVSMIENFLLDPRAIWRTIEGVAEKTTLRNVAEVEMAIDAILDDMEEWEVERRVIAMIGRRVFQAHRPVLNVSSQLGEFMNEIQQGISDEKLRELMQSSRQIVQSTRDPDLRRNRYHGKEVLTRFYKKHLHKTGLSRELFTYFVAREIRGRRGIREYFNMFFSTHLPGIHAPDVKESEGGSEGA